VVKVLQISTKIAEGVCKHRRLRKPGHGRGARR
jgi:hypothetical protein